MSESKEVLLEIKDAIATITLNRPDRYNAVNIELQKGILESLDIVKNDTSIRALIITGAGKGFCAGADLHGFGDNPSAKDVRDNLVRAYGGIIRSMIELEIPIIAAINGPVAGAGLGFALAADYKIMADTASMTYAFVNIALGPDAGSGWLLARTVGYNKALEIAIGGEKMSASECLHHGLVNKIVTLDDLTSSVTMLAEKLAKKPPLAFAATKRVMHCAMHHGLMDTLAYEAQQQMIPIGSKDHKEGITAFFEKRAPVFKGQ